MSNILLALKFRLNHQSHVAHSNLTYRFVFILVTFVQWMVMFVTSCYTIWLSGERNCSCLTTSMPFTAFPIDFICIFIILNILAAFTNHHLIATSRLDEAEWHRVGCWRWIVWALSLHWWLVLDIFSVWLFLHHVIFLNKCDHFAIFIYVGWK